MPALLILRLFGDPYLLTFIVINSLIVTYITLQSLFRSCILYSEKRIRSRLPEGLL